MIMKKKYYIGLDQGTTGTTTLLLDETWNVVARGYKEHTQYYPKPGWVEHDPLELWQRVMESMSMALSEGGVSAEDVACIGIDNQGETVMLWDKVTGAPVYNAIVWQDRRMARYADELTTEYGELIREKTGLMADSYFSGPKIKWIIDNVDGVKEKIKEGRVLAGTLDSWLIWKMTHGKVHVTDCSTASRTMMFNIHTLKWDEEILAELDIPACMLPEPCPSSMVFGESSPLIFGGPVKIAGAAGDQQSALFGQACFKEGEAKNTYGTGGFMLVNTGETPVESRNGLLTTIAWGLDGKVCYALEGSVFVSGATIQWLRDEVRILDNAAESEKMARSVDDTAGAYIVPAFTGLGAPYWDPYARGALMGLTRGVNKNHIVRAALESMAYQTYDLMNSMTEDMGYEIKTFKVDGGACANDFLLEFQSDIINMPLYRPECIETTSLGAAYLAGLATGYWKNTDDIISNWQINNIFRPDMDEERRQTLIDGWHRAVKCTLGWAK